jgi:hypothetical protein
MRLAWISIALVSCGAASTPPAPTRAIATASASASIAADAGATEEPPLADAATWARWRDADYVMIAPARFSSTLAPLVKHREAHGRVVAQLDASALYERYTRGHRDARALRDGVARLAAHAPKLRFVLLAGDVDHASEVASDASLPTFYAKKLDYEHHTADEHRRVPSAVTQPEHAKYPTDHPLEIARGDATRLAVGRIPARTEAELAAVVQKIIDYETREPDGEWRRRVSITTGPANYGAVADAVIESIATHMLDEELSYDYDVRFTFAKADSPYAPRPDKLRDRFVAELGDGALVAAYVGHGAATSFDHVYWRGGWYEIATADDAAALRIAAGKPIFFSFACDTGAYDRPSGVASLAEQMILNPRGPVAVFASSRESHPYTNALYAAAVIHRFVDERAATVGEGILAIKETMVARSMAGAELMVDVDVEALKREHEGLYNLFGDPATVLRYPDAAKLTLDDASARPGDKVTLTIASPVSGTAQVTLETPRSVIRGALTPQSSIEQMGREDALVAIDDNRRKAADKIVARATATVTNGAATVTLTAPKQPGRYVVKGIVAGPAAGVAIGSVALRVAP